MFVEANRLLRQSEIEQFDPLLDNNYVARFQIPMSDALLVRRIQGIENLARLIHGPFER
jgi:hypothetical protein